MRFWPRFVSRWRPLRATVKVRRLRRLIHPSQCSRPLTWRERRIRTLLSAQQNLLSVKAQELQAGVRQNPNLVVTGSNVTIGEESNNPYYYSVGVNRLFERGEKRRWRLDIARSTTAQTDAQYHAQEQQTILSVRQAFTNFVIAKAAKKLADDNLNDFRHELDIGRERLKAGDIAKLDFERLDLQLAQFEIG